MARVAGGGSSLKVAAQVYDFSPQDIDEITAEIRGLLADRRYLTLGAQGERFESAFARYHSLPHAIATSSGTAALEIILRHIDVSGGEVIIPTNTFAATAFAVLAAGGRPVFADIREDLTLDPISVGERVTTRTRAVVTVHIGGLVSPATPSLADLCREKGVAFVEDAAHAHGSAFAGRPAGSFGLAGAFSFFTTKVMTTGEGGMIVTSDAALHASARMLRDQAKVEGRNFHERVGYNWRLSELHAILGLAQLRRLDEFIARRQAIAAIYDGALSSVPGLRPLSRPEAARHNYYKYICLLDTAPPAEVAAALRQRYGVAVSGSVYELPLHEQPVFRDYATCPLPVAERLCRQHICLPLYPSLTDEQAVYVANAIDEILRAV